MKINSQHAVFFFLLILASSAFCKEFSLKISAEDNPCVFFSSTKEKSGKICFLSSGNKEADNSITSFTSDDLNAFTLTNEDIFNALLQIKIKDSILARLEKRIFNLIQEEFTAGVFLNEVKIASICSSVNTAATQTGEVFILKTKPVNFSSADKSALADTVLMWLSKKILPAVSEKEFREILLEKFTKIDKAGQKKIATVEFLNLKAIPIYYTKESMCPICGFCDSENPKEKGESIKQPENCKRSFLGNFLCNLFFGRSPLTYWEGPKKSVPSDLFFMPGSMQLTFKSGNIREIKLCGKIVKEKDNSIKPPTSGNKSDAAEVQYSIINSNAEFSNPLPVPFTTSAYLNQLNSEKIYSLHMIENFDEERYYYLDLSKVIHVNRELLLNDSYSPMDTLINLKPGESAELYKQELSRNFDLRLYTEVFGYDKKLLQGTLEFEAQYKFIWTAETWGENTKRLLNYSKYALPAVALAFSTKSNVPSCNRKAIYWGSGLYFIFATYLGHTPYVTFFHTLSPFVGFYNMSGTKSMNLTTKSYDAESEKYKEPQSVSRLDLLRNTAYKLGIESKLLKLGYRRAAIETGMNCEFAVYANKIDTIMLGKKPGQWLNNEYLYSLVIFPNLYARPIDIQSVDFTMKAGPVFMGLLKRKLSGLGDEVQTDQKLNLWLVQCDLNLYPDTKDRSSWFFMRMNYYCEATDGFMNIKIGYETSFSALFGK